MFSFAQNEVYNYHGPSFIGTEKLTSDDPISQRHSSGEIGGGILSSNGGGKDSFLALKLLEESGFEVHVFQHARSEYGRFDHQHNIQKQFHPHVNALKEGRARVHEISVLDDFTDGSIMGLINPQLRGDAIKGYPCQVGWPECCIESLPFMLVHDYSAFCLGNERSADSAQVTEHSGSGVNMLDGGRAVNHQWLKSFEACEALKNFLRKTLIKDIEVFSILKPLHDYRIYQILKRYPQVLPDIHSCNILKPWCKRCSKCAYGQTKWTSQSSAVADGACTMLTFALSHCFFRFFCSLVESDCHFWLRCSFFRVSREFVGCSISSTLLG